MTETVLLSRHLTADLIHLRADMSSPKKLLQTMAGLLSSALDEPDERAVYQCLIERERLGNTGIGNGIALPHSRCDLTDKAVVAIITLEDAINYDSLDNQPVSIAFGLLVPQEANQEHLQILAEIARMMSNNDNKQQLLSALNPQEVIDLISGW